MGDSRSNQSNNSGGMRDFDVSVDAGIGSVSASKVGSKYSVDVSGRISAGPIKGLNVHYDVDPTNKTENVQMGVNFGAHKVNISKNVNATVSGKVQETVSKDKDSVSLGVGGKVTGALNIGGIDVGKLDIEASTRFQQTISPKPVPSAQTIGTVTPFGPVPPVQAFDLLGMLFGNVKAQVTVGDKAIFSGAVNVSTSPHPNAAKPSQVPGNLNPASPPAPTNASGAGGYKSDAATSEASRRAGVAATSNVSGAGGYKSDAATSEASRRAGVAATSNVSGAGGYKSDAATGEASRRSGGGDGGGRGGNGATSGGGARAPGGSPSRGSQGGGRGAATQGGGGGVSVSGSRESGPGVGRASTSHTAGSGGHFGVPVLLDLAGNGLDVDGLDSSNRFVDLAGDGYEYRTAWAGDGNGVLVFDADGNGKISRSSEFIFTEWDKTETSDLRAIKKVFDTNSNGKLDAGDARWADFKVMVGDQLLSLDSLGITSIDLTPKGSGQSFDDGSAITGTTTYTKSDGTTGQVGDAVLAGDENGYIIKRTKTTNADDSTTEDLHAYNKDGSSAFRNQITTSSDGSYRHTKFDDDGNGTFDRSQSVQRSNGTDGVRTRVVANFNADGSLHDRTTTVTSSDHKSVTTLLDQDGDGTDDQIQVLASNADGSTSTTLKKLAANGSLLQQTVTTSSADGLTKIVKLDETGSGTFNVETSELIVIASDGTHTKTATQKSANGSLITRAVTVTSADGRSKTIDYDRAGAGSIDEKELSVTATAVDGSVTNTVTSYNPDGTLRSKTIATTSADGLAHTVAEDLDGDGVADRTTANVTMVAADGSRSQTAEQRSGNATLLSKQVTTTSADRKTISAVIDANGDGAADETNSTVVDASGVTTSIVAKLNANGSPISKVQSVSSADGLTQTTDEDLDGDATYDRTTTDVTIVNADGSRTQTVQHYARGGAASGSLLDKVVITISQDSLTKSTTSDINGDGVIDRTVVDAIVLNGDNSRTETITNASNNGAKLAQTVTTVSADRKTTMIAEDLNGDNAVDRTTVTTTNADGSKVATVTERASNGTIIRRNETDVSANGLATTTRSDVNGDGSNDVTTTQYLVINGDGSRTTTSKEWAGTTLVTQRVVSVSGNGLNKTTLVDLNGDLTFDTKEEDSTLYNTDGSTIRTVTQFAGSDAVASRKKITTSANGLTTKVDVDLDADGTYDRSTTTVKQFGVDGSTTEVLEERSGDGTRLSKTTTTISADKKNTTTTVDSDGNGTTDFNKSISVGNDGVVTTTEKALSANGTLISSKQSTISGNGLSATVKEDWNGDGTYEKTLTSTVVLNADGSRTETVAATSANGTLLSGKTITTTSASGLSKVEQVDLTGDGVVDETTSSIKTLGLDGSETLTAETRSGNATLLARSVETTSVDRKTRTASYDDNGDGVIDRTVGTVVNANGSTTTTATDFAANGATIARKVTDVSADGLTTTVREDFDGNGTFDKVAVDQTTIGADGAKTKRVTEQLGSGPSTVVSQSTMAANAYEVSTDNYDRGWLENRNTKKTVLNTDGTVTTTETNVAGSQASLVNETTTTVFANGLVAVSFADIDGNGAVDRTSITKKTLSPDGKTTETVSVWNRNANQVAKTTTTTSPDRNKVTAQYDLDGDGYDDLVKVSTKQANGSTIETVATYSGTGTTWGQSSLSTKTTSADGLTETIETDSNGDEATDRSSRSTTVINSDGSKTQTFTNSGPGGAIKDKTIVTTSANGLVVSTEWMANGTSTTRALEDVTTLNADGSTARSLTYKKAGGALESKSITTTSADKKAVTKTFDVDGNGVVDQKSTRVVNADGSVTTTYLDLGADGVQVKARKIVSESANGLTVTTDYDTNSDGTIDNRVVEATVLNADGSETTTVTRFSGTSQAIERTIVVLSADGKTQTTSYDLNADGTIDKRQTTSTAFGAHSSYADAKTDTIENVVGSAVTSRFATSMSANGQSTTREWDVDGNGTIDQTSTETTSITNQGTVRTVSSFVGGTKISGMTTTTSNDGRTVTTVEERPQIGFSNRTITTSVATLSDGSTIERKTLTNTTNGVVEKQVTTTSADDREVTIERDIDGNGTVDQLEQRTKFVDGSTKTVITGYNSNDRTTFTSSADGLYSTIEWDMDKDGAVDRRRTVTNIFNADGSQSSIATDYKIVAGSADKRVRISSSFNSADGRSISNSVDTNGDGIFDKVALTTIDASGGSVTTTTNNAEAQKAENIVIGEIYWKQAITAKVNTTVSADGLTTTEQSDYDGNGTFEVTAVSRTRIDGSVITEYTEVNASGAVIAKGTLTVSNDGRTKMLNKDTDNDGFYDHGEKTEQFIEGQIVYSTADYNSNGTLKQHTAASILANGNLAHSTVWDGANHKTEEYIRWSNGTAVKYTFVGADEAIRSAHTLNKAGNLVSGTYYDPKNTDPWTRIEQSFNSDGKKTLEKQFMDDGGIANIVYDVANTQTWTSNTERTDAAGRNIYGDLVFDDGTKYLEHRDPANKEIWKTIAESYNAAGLIIARTQYNDDLTRIYITFDVPGGKKKQADTYDSADRLIARATFTNGILATNVLYDPTNANPWTRVEQTYTSDGTKVASESQFMDDGTRINIGFDTANTQIWSSNTERYDAAGRNIYGDLLYDNGTRYAEYRDPANAYNWRLISQYLNASGVKTEETTFFDDGTKAYTAYDAAGAQPWKNNSTWFDVAGRVVQYEVNYDDGTRYLDYRDAANASYWSMIVQHFNAQGQGTDYIEKRDDGSSTAIYYDPTNIQNWNTVYYYYDTAGRCTNEDIRYDDGTRYFDYRDVANSQSWNVIWEKYNASGQITYQRRNNDDGSFSATDYDATNAYSWTSYTSLWNASSQCYQEVYIYDNGVRTDIWQGALVGQSYKTYQQDSLADGRVTYTKLTNYNNTYTTTQYDAYSQYNWTRWEKFYSSDNVLMSDKIYFDNGSVGTTTGPIGGGGGVHRPVVLDLNKDNGIDVLSLAAETDQSGPRFDWNGDGVTDQTSWAGSNDGFLAIDLAENGSTGPDGLINQAKELAFTLWLNGGNAATSDASDLEALALVFDTNNDKVLDSSDARWSEFRIWQDANQNGITDAGELRTLADAGVTAIGLVPDPAGAVSFIDGSEITGTSWYAAADGTRNLVGDVSLVSRPSEPDGPAPLIAANRTGSSMPANVKVDNLIAAMASFGADTDAGSIELQNSGDTTEPWKQGQLAASSAVWNAA